jgi:hypothetical protein
MLQDRAFDVNPSEHCAHFFRAKEGIAQGFQTVSSRLIAEATRYLFTVICDSCSRGNCYSFPRVCCAVIQFFQRPQRLHLFVSRILGDPRVRLVFFFKRLASFKVRSRIGRTAKSLSRLAARLLAITRRSGSTFTGIPSSSAQ